MVTLRCESFFGDYLPNGEIATVHTGNTIELSNVHARKVMAGHPGVFSVVKTPRAQPARQKNEADAKSEPTPDGGDGSEGGGATEGTKDRDLEVVGDGGEANGQ